MVEHINGVTRREFEEVKDRIRHLEETLTAERIKMAYLLGKFSVVAATIGALVGALVVRFVGR